MNATTLPILDLARYADPADKAAFLADLRHAARDIGFFYLINHGVDDALQYEVQRQSQRFFALDEAQKQQVAMIHSPHFRGYNRAASELTRGQPDWREQFDIGAERPALTLSDDAPRWQRLQGPNLWPAALPSLKPVLLHWQQQMTQVGIRLLRAFAVVAEENNISRAAQRLFISQPPLTRHIRHLEAQLGVTLFQRHSKGLILTDAGREVLEMIQPLLALQERTLAALSELAAHSPQALRLGVTTAFEQGIFAAVEATLSEHTRALHITRHASPALAQQVRKGKLDAALVALPLNTEGLHLHPLPYHEPLIAALPASWPEAARPGLTLSALNHRPLFWFKRERNPGFFDYTRRIFDRAGYAPTYVEEPAEHDVLLARIARGEGMILLPASFCRDSASGGGVLPGG